MLELLEMVKLLKVTTADTVAAPSVAPTQVASPFVPPTALLIWTSFGSETVQVALLAKASHCGTGQPGPGSGATTAWNCS